MKIPIRGGLAALVLALTTACNDGKPVEKAENKYQSLIVERDCESNPPEVSFESITPTNPKVFQKVNFTFNFTDPDGAVKNVFRYELNPGTGFPIQGFFRSEETSGTFSVDFEGYKFSRKYVPSITLSDGCNLVTKSKPLGVHEWPSTPREVNQPPTINFLNPNPTTVNQNETKRYEVNALDPENGLLLFRFDMGDGRIVEWTSSKAVNHAFNASGTFYPEACVKDEENQACDVLEVEVLPVDENRAPVVTITNPSVNPVTINEGSSLNIAFSALDPDGDSTDCELDCGNDTILSDVNNEATCTYNEPGTFTATVSATDGLVTGRDSLEVRVNSIPTVNLTVNGSDTETFDTQVGVSNTYAVVAADADGDQISSRIEADTTAIKDWSLEHFVEYAFANSGTYTLRGLVSDGNGGNNQKEITVNVTSGFFVNAGPDMALQRDVSYCFVFVKELCSDFILEVFCGSEPNYAPGHSRNGFAHSSDITEVNIYPNIARSDVSYSPDGCRNLKYRSAGYVAGETATVRIEALNAEGNITFDDLIITFE